MRDFLNLLWDIGPGCKDRAVCSSSLVAILPYFKPRLRWTTINIRIYMTDLGHGGLQYYSFLGTIMAIECRSIQAKVIYIQTQDK